MAARRKPQRAAQKRVAKRRTKAVAAPTARQKPSKRRRRKPSEDEDPSALVPDLPPTETVQESLLHIAQDAVIILRRELQWKAQLAMLRPGMMNMSDCIALLKLTTELGEAAKRGDGDGPQASYERLSPDERVQLAALLLKVDYN